MPGPFIGPRGGKWRDAQHTIPWSAAATKSGGHSEVSRDDAVRTIVSGIRQNARAGWLRNEDRAYKPEIAASIHGDKKVHNATLNIMHQQFMVHAGKKVSFQEFLDTPTTLYRAGAAPESEAFVSYSFDKKMADKFADKYKSKTESITIKPRDTLGMINEMAEGEVLVPSKDPYAVGKRVAIDGKDWTVAMRKPGRAYLTHGDKKRMVTDTDLDGLSKSTVITWGQTSVDGQVPGRNHGHAQGMRLDPELEKLTTQRPADWSEERFHERPIVSARDIVSGLGLSASREDILATQIQHEVDTTMNAMQLRRNLMQMFLTEAFLPEARQHVVSRAVQYFQSSMTKSHRVEIYTPDELLQKAEATGGKYYKRSTNDSGRHRYFYDQADYEKSKGAHVDGGEARSSFIKNAVYTKTCKAGGGGCEVSAFENLSKRFGHKAVYDAAKSLADEQKVFFKGAKFFKGSPPDKKADEAGAKAKAPLQSKRSPSTERHLLKETRVTKEYAGPDGPESKTAEVQKDDPKKKGKGKLLTLPGLRKKHDSKFTMKDKPTKKSERFVIVTDVLQKGGLPPGTVRDWKGGKFKKKANGKWAQVSGDKKEKKESSPKRRPKVGSDEYIRMPWKETLPSGFLPPASGAGGKKGIPGERGGSEQMHWDARRGDFTDARLALHDRISDKTFKGKTPQIGKPTAIVMMGGTASGKSTMLRNSGLADENFVHLDADDVKKELPEYQQAIGEKSRGAAAFAHRESSEVAYRMGDQAVTGNFNVVFDGTGADVAKAARQIEVLRANGYHIHLMMPDQDKAVALRDASERADATGRYVPAEFIERGYDQIPGNFFKLAKLTDSAQLFDRRQNSKLVWEGSSGQSTTHDSKFMETFPGYKEAANG